MAGWLDGRPGLAWPYEEAFVRRARVRVLLLLY